MSRGQAAVSRKLGGIDCHDNKVPLGIRKLNEPSSCWLTQINLLVTILQHGTGALILLTARCIMFRSSNFPSFVLITELFFLQSWQLQGYAGEWAFLFCDKLL